MGTAKSVQKSRFSASKADDEAVMSVVRAARTAVGGGSECTNADLADVLSRALTVVLIAGELPERLVELHRGFMVEFETGRAKLRRESSKAAARAARTGRKRPSGRR